MIPRQRSTAVRFQPFERRVKSNLKGLAKARLDELTVVRRHCLFYFYFLMLCGEGEDSERGETKFSAEKKLPSGFSKVWVNTLRKKEVSDAFFFSLKLEVEQTDSNEISLLSLLLLLFLPNRLILTLC